MSEYNEYVQAITSLDSESEVVKVDINSNKVAYNKSIVCHRNIEKLTKEEIVRAFLVVKLVKELRYDLDCIELETEYSIGRPKEVGARLDIKVMDKRNGKRVSFLLIEVKAPDKYENDGKFSKEDYIEGQLFAIGKQEIDPKYLIYYTCEPIGSKLSERKIIIDFSRFNSFEEWKDGGSISLDKIPKEYGIARKSIFVNKNDLNELSEDEKHLDTSLGNREFNSIRKDLHDVLWGGGGDYNIIFNNLIKLFLTKIYDEETTEEGQPYRFQISLKDGELETPREVYDKINALFKDAQIQYLNADADEVNNSVGIDTQQISESKVAYVVEKLQGISLTKNMNDGDILGDFFESIVSNGFKQNKGQFFTHTNIVRFILHALNIEKLAIDLLNDPIKPRLPYIIDPSCGSGTFVIEAMKMITSKVTSGNNGVKRTSRIQQFVDSNFPKSKPNIWAREFIYSIEKDPVLGLTTKVNMILHGDGNINTFIKDGLEDFEKYVSKSPYGNILNISKSPTELGYKRATNEQFDVVISNPPFSIKLDTETQKGLPKRFVYSDMKKPENLFVERWYQLLREGGRIGVVLPDSFFDTKENLYIRLFLYRFFKINYIVSLPSLAFAPFTNTKTSLLFTQKRIRARLKSGTKTGDISRMNLEN